MNRIRAARQARGWTQAELAERARVSPRTVHAIEKGQACRQATKRRLLAALMVPWELRHEYFPEPRRVRRPARVAAPARARAAQSA
jgi:transcriptional regulator with XRE-family HTH domain